MLMAFTSHHLQEGISEAGESMIGMLETKRWGSYERSMISQHLQVQDEPGKSDMFSP
jgi:hypothetical protein